MNEIHTLPRDLDSKKAEFFIEKLSLHYFRSYEELTLQTSSKFITLVGPNGAGKTNVLEAISLLAPGRGLRNAKTKDIQNIAYPEKDWALSTKLMTPLGAAKIGTGRERHTDIENKDKRIIRIDGETKRAQSSLADYTALLWLTPQMEKIFLDGSSTRRRFLDRFVFSFDPAHAGRITRYDNALRQRSKLLKSEKWDEVWLNTLEKNIAETGIAIAAARLEFAKKINVAISKLDHFRESFPNCSVSILGTIESKLKSFPALDVEEFFLSTLKTGRKTDAETGGASIGPHKSDLHVHYIEKNMPADQCSTGEQKALLITLILAQSFLIKQERGFPPILLLDDIASHLDEKRRENMFDYLGFLDSQSWITGTNIQDFDTIKNKSDFFVIRDSKLL